MGKRNTRESLEVEGVLLVAALTVFLGIDPFNISMGAGVRDFQTSMWNSPWRIFLRNLPCSKPNKLRNAEIMKWQPGEFHAPQSVPFDLQGRSDGCVLRYDGPIT